MVGTFQSAVEVRIPLRTGGSIQRFVCFVLYRPSLCWMHYYSKYFIVATHFFVCFL